MAKRVEGTSSTGGRSLSVAAPSRSGRRLGLPSPEPVCTTGGEPLVAAARKEARIIPPSPASVFRFQPGAGRAMATGLPREALGATAMIGGRSSMGSGEPMGPGVGSAPPAMVAYQATATQKPPARMPFIAWTLIREGRKAGPCRARLRPWRASAGLWPILRTAAPARNRRKEQGGGLPRLAWDE